jgi:ribosome modulation factor
MGNMIRLYSVRRHSYVQPGYARRPTPFDPDFPSVVSFFRQHGIVFTDHPGRCDLFVVSHDFPPWWYTWKRKAQLLLRYQFRRRLLIWSDEPANVAARTFKWSIAQPAAHVMNIYTRDVLLSNFTTSDWSLKKNLPFKRLQDCPKDGKARIVGLVGYVAEPKPKIIQGENRDLNCLRMNLMREGHERGRIDIYGTNWPNGMSKEESRAGNWWTRKREVLKDYDICVALENTNFDHYCTEKIFQAIEGGCLPIYFGRGNRIYDTFPTRSFIDAAEFNSVQEVYEFIDAMSQQEYFDRYNRCVEANNSAAASFDIQAERMAVLGKVVERVYEIVGKPAPRLSDHIEKPNIYEVGYIAGLRGDDQSLCPFEDGTTERKDWERGRADGVSKVL